MHVARFSLVQIPDLQRQDLGGDGALEIQRDLRLVHAPFQDGADLHRLGSFPSK